MKLSFDSCVQGLENAVAIHLKWRTVADIPDFPFPSFDEATKKIEEDQFSVGIRHEDADHVALRLIGSRADLVLWQFLGSAQFLTAGASILLALILRNPLLLVGLPLGFLGTLLSNPYNPLRRLLGAGALALSLLFFWTVVQGQHSTPYLLALFVLPFWMSRLFYRLNWLKTKRAVLASETLFIFLYQSGCLGFEDRATHRTYWDREGVLLRATGWRPFR